VQQAKAQRRTLWRSDPYRSDTAQKCHRQVALLPGTDGALALGIAHVLIREGWLDRDYIDRYTLGFDALAGRAGDFPPERVARSAASAPSRSSSWHIDYWHIPPGGDPAELPACSGRPAVATRCARWPACRRSPATGATRPAAVLLSSSGVAEVDSERLYRPDLLAGPDGRKRQPRTINMSTIGAALADAQPPIEALIVYDSNPVAVAPDSRMVAAGFAREDLFTVVLEHFRTDTADYADYLLRPHAARALDVHKSYGHLYVLANNPAIEPLGEALPNSEIFRRLAAKMGFTEPCFAETDDQLAAQAFRRSGANGELRLERLKQAAGSGLDVPQPYAPFAQGGYPTPSGRCEFRSQALADAGLDPLPGYGPPHEGADSAAAARYPLAIISPRRATS